MRFVPDPQPRGPPERRLHICAPTSLNWSPSLTRAQPNQKGSPAALPPAKESPSRRGGEAAAATADLRTQEMFVDRPPCPTIWVKAGTLSGEQESPSATSCESASAQSAEIEAQQLRRGHSIFTLEQLCQLEKTFSEKQYLRSEERKELAASLHLRDLQVRVWFQNRRRKHKQEIEDHYQRIQASLSYSLVYKYGIQSRLFHGFPIYPHILPQQRLLPFLPASDLQSISSCSLYHQIPNPFYPLLTPDLPYFSASNLSASHYAL
ncbi:homeobox protein MSH-D-like [Hemicordylus capensis]|uniref:homeobox protein MSH-D-like n=1 Tax=Hemicordylus capensis TaxID=884348 RepID=UPI002302C17D|nr:homeobox protein MSH-D-like [Hemicordylus capensis]